MQLLVARLSQDISNVIAAALVPYLAGSPGGTVAVAAAAPNGTAQTIQPSSSATDPDTGSLSHVSKSATEPPMHSNVSGLTSQHSEPVTTSPPVVIGPDGDQWGPTGPTVGNGARRAACQR